MIHSISETRPLTRECAEAGTRSDFGVDRTVAEQAGGYNGTYTEASRFAVRGLPVEDSWLSTALCVSPTGIFTASSHSCRWFHGSAECRRKETGFRILAVTWEAVGACLTAQDTSMIPVADSERLKTTYTPHQSARGVDLSTTRLKVTRSPIN